MSSEKFINYYVAILTGFVIIGGNLTEIDMKSFRVQALVVPHNSTKSIAINYLVDAHNSDACLLEFKSYNKEVNYYCITETSSGTIEKLWKRHYT